MTPPPSWPTFSKQYADDANSGTRFHEFISALFGPEHAGFAAFLSDGKDGAIDCFHADGIVWECKFIGAAGFSAAKMRWNEVSKHLHDNLLPGTPKSTQYAPWYNNSSTAIHRYLFCTSNTLENTARMQELEALIRADFCALAKRDGLAHLEKIQVEVWSWERIAPKLENHPHLRLRWFPNPVPPVFKSLETWMLSYSRGFRAYLRASVLPYVPLLDAELAPQRILSAFLESDEPCSVLTGIGGAGKSRLLAETAAQAHQLGWLVYMPAASLCRSDILELARLLGDEPVFIGLDYLEKCAQFEAVVDTLREVNAGGKHLYLLASCRQSHWLQIDHLGLVRYSLAKIDLTNVVRDILGPELQRFAPECGKVPVFAAFVRFLAATKQDAALQELQKSQDFESWLVTHILKAGNLAKDARPTDLEQARFLLMLPACEAAIQQLERDAPKLTAWRTGLEEDGWLSSDLTSHTDGSLLWQSAHDVIADGTLLRVLRETGNRHATVVRLLASSHACDAVTSSLETLQRIAQDPCLQEFDWLQAFAVNKPQWRPHVAAIFSARLLSLTQYLPLLQWYQDDMAQLVLNNMVQGGLGATARALVKAELKLNEEQQAQLLAWLLASVQNDNEFNFALTQAFRWQAPKFRAAALNYLCTHPAEYQTHFLLTAWLNAARDLHDATMLPQVRGVLTTWLKQYASWPSCSFVIVAYLKTGQDAIMVKDAIYAWLKIAKNRIAPDASFVFSAWLDAKQDAGLVKDAILDWLQVPLNRIAPDASFIFSAWLDAKQDAGVVKDAILDWLQVPLNRIAPEANFIFKSWLDAKQDAGVVKDAILDWLQVPLNRIAPEAGFIFKSWLDAKQDAGVVKDAILDWLQVPQNRIAPDASFIFKSWLDAKQDAGVVKDAILDWLQVPLNRIAPEARFIFKSWLDAKQDAGVVKDAILDWLKVPLNRIAPEANFIFTSWLDAKQSPKLIELHVLAWLAYGENAINPGAGFIYRAWGDRFKYLDDAMFKSACLWLQAHRHHSDAAYCMKFIAGDRRLDQATASAIIDWLAAFPAHEDAPSRLVRLHFHALRHCSADVLLKLYVAVLAHYIERARRFGEWDVKTTFYLFINAVRIAKRPSQHPPTRLPLARVFCNTLRTLNAAQMQHLIPILPNLTGGVLSGLLRHALQTGEVLDSELANQCRWLAQAYANLGETGASDAALLRQLVQTYSVSLSKP